MPYDFVVLGGTGLQGRICARDLLESGYSVLLCGRDPTALRSLLRKWKRRAHFHYLDLCKQQALVRVLRSSGAKVVVNCAELTFNVAVMRACLVAGISCTDLGGLQQITARQFSLHRAFKAKQLLCLTGCGSTPGIANVLVRYGVERLDAVHKIDLGFAWDSDPRVFVVPYSLPSIFTEFRERPVVYDNGHFRARAPYELLKTFPTIGSQRIKGIAHSEVYTLPRYFPALRSVRYFAGFPEHSRTYIEALRALHGDDPATLPYTLRLLKHLVPPPGYREWEVLWAELRGISQGISTTLHLACFVHTQKGWEEAGSNIDTGRTISIMSQMMYRKEITAHGVHAPEGVVPWKPFFRALKRRGMRLFCNGRRIQI